MNTTEKKTSKAILQDPEIIEIAGRKYSAPAPTTATLIRVSELIAELPSILPPDGSSILEYTLKHAKDCAPVAKIAATLVAGAQKPTTIKMPFFKRDKIKSLTEIILHRLTPSQTKELVAQMLSRMEIADFFALTTSLISINIAKPTREVVKTNETTASGL